VPDEGPNFADGSVDLLKIMMLAGAAVGIISVFLVWFSWDPAAPWFNYTGYDLFMNARENSPYSGLFSYMPLTILIASAVAAAASVLSFTKRERNGAIFGMVSGAAVLASALTYILYPLSMIKITEPGGGYIITDIRPMDYMDAGPYSALVAGAFLILGGAAVLLRARTGAGDQEHD
jgi:hypothetical protein